MGFAGRRLKRVVALCQPRLIVGSPASMLGWISRQAEERGDVPVSETNLLHLCCFGLRQVHLSCAIRPFASAQASVRRASATVKP